MPSVDSLVCNLRHSRTVASPVSEVVLVPPRVGFRSGSAVEDPPAVQEVAGSIPGLETFPWRRERQPILELVPGKSPG